MLTAENIAVECVQKHPGKRVPIDLTDFVGLMLDAVKGGGGVEHTFLSIVDSRMTEQSEAIASALDQVAQRIEAIEAKSVLPEQQVVTIIDDRLRTADEQLSQSIASLVQTAQSLVQRIERIEGVMDELASLVKAVRS